MNTLSRKLSWRSVFVGVTAFLAVMSANAQSFRPVGGPGISLSNHTANLLFDSRVVAAGESGTAIYDPANGQWTASSAFNEPRKAHATVMLLTGPSAGHLMAIGGLYRTSVTTVRSSVELFDAKTGAWSLGSAMHTARSLFTATVLADGRVLAVGGYDGLAQGIASAEIYDPVSGQWTQAAPMQHARFGHAATLLPNGKVLVSGGLADVDTNLSHLASSEVFDPTTGQWSPTGDLLTPRAYHTATLLPNGKLMVVGGTGNGGVAHASAEYFIDAAQSWIPAPAMGGARRGHTATLLADGRLMIAGGSDKVSNSPIATYQLFDPANAIWNMTSPLTSGRVDHAATLLANGSVMLVGGVGGPVTAEQWTDWFIGAEVPSNPLPDMAVSRKTPVGIALADGSVAVEGGGSLERYDAAGGAWSTPIPAAFQREAHTGVLLRDGSPLFSGGHQVHGTPTQSEHYDATSEQLLPTLNSNADVDRAAMVLLDDGSALLTGGYGAVNGGLGVSDACERYMPDPGAWFPVASMYQKRFAHTATMLRDGRVLVAGGALLPGAVTASVEIYDPVSDTWTPQPNGMNVARAYHTATLLSDGRVLVAGGTDANDVVLPSAEIFDPATGQWTQVASLSAASALHRATLLPSGRVLIAGGRGGGMNTSAVRVYDPAVNVWFQTSVSLTKARAGHIQTLLADGLLFIAANGNFSSENSSAELLAIDASPFAARRPQIDQIALQGDASVSVLGSGFRPMYETGISQTNFPLLQLRDIANERIYWLPVSASVGIGDGVTRSAAGALLDVPVGNYRVTLFVNGLPSKGGSILQWSGALPPQTPMVFHDGFE